MSLPRRAPASALDVPHGPVTRDVPGPALTRAFLHLDELHGRRLALKRRKRRLLQVRQRLVDGLPPEWRIAHDARKYSHDLGGIEFRDETALVDQFALLDHYLTQGGDVVHEDVEVRSEENRDERLWSYVLRGEAIFVRKFIQPQERWIREQLQRQRRGLGRARQRLAEWRRAIPVLGVLATVLAYPFLLLGRLGVKLESLLFLNVVKGQAALADTAVSLPLTVKSSYHTARGELRSGESRRKLRLAIFNERLWTPERRKTLLFFIAVAGLAIYLFSEIVIDIAFPSLLRFKRQMDLVFFYAIGTRLFLPTPFEPILLSGARILGEWPAIVIAACGATAGSYLLFLVGGKANEGLHKLGKKRPWIGRSLTWLENKGRKHAYWILGLLLSIPLSPDSLAILGTLLRLRLGRFLITIFLSTIVRGFIFLAILHP